MYTAKVIEKIDNGKGYWGYNVIGVFRNDEQVGSYKRNYDNFYNTFCPFKIGEDWFALYSEHYTATAVMELPSCKKIACEEPNKFGFCPTDYYAARYWKCFIEGRKDKDYLDKIPEANRSWACKDATYYDYDIPDDVEEKDIFYDIKNFFLAGCYWGDDSSWKIQHLDLSQVKQGKIVRSDRFGYIHKPSNLTLKDCIHIQEYGIYEDGTDNGPEYVSIDCTKLFKIKSGESCE